MGTRPSSDELVGEAFLAAWPGAARSSEAAPLGARLVEAASAAAARFSGVTVDPERFARFVAARTALDAPPLAGLEALRLDELYLVCGCLDGLPGALERFDAEFLDKLPRHLARLRPSASFIDEIRQALRARLLVRDGDGPPRIGQFGGRGPLDGWVRVAAMRLALDATSADQRRASDRGLEEALLSGAAPAHGFETQYLKAQYRDEVTAAFREALATLEARSRLLLRLHYVDGLAPAAIGQLYAVHRTTAQRWIESAESELLASVREGIRARLRLSVTECDSLLGLLRSQLDVTLSPLLGAKDQP